MAYIGKQPVVGNFQVCDAITVVNGQAAYTMQVSSANVEPENANHMLVSLNGILQKPGSSFTISGATITFASNLATGDSIDFIILLGNVLDIGTPSDATVTSAKLSGVNEITVADQWRLSANRTSVTSSFLTANLEQVDTTGQGTIGSAMTQSSGVFTFPSTGFYLVSFSLLVYAAANDGFVDAEIHVTTDNSTYAEVGKATSGIYMGTTGDSVSNSGVAQTIIDVTDTSNVKVKFYVDTLNSTTTVYGSSTATLTGFTFMRLGDT